MRCCKGEVKVFFLTGLCVYHDQDLRGLTELMKSASGSAGGLVVSCHRQQDKGVAAKGQVSSTCAQPRSSRRDVEVYASHLGSAAVLSFVVLWRADAMLPKASPCSKPSSPKVWRRAKYKVSLSAVLRNLEAPQEASLHGRSSFPARSCGRLVT